MVARMNIVLNDELYLASGSRRDVYIHPEDENLCIKIQKSNGKHNLYEEEFYKKHPDVELLPQYKGQIKTNLGRGLVVELIRDFDGEISQSLHNYLTSKTISAKEAYDYVKHIADEIVNHKILLHDDNLNNVLLKKTAPNSFKPVLVDGFGVRNNSLKYRLRKKFSFLALRKSKQQLALMANRVSHQFK